MSTYVWGAVARASCRTVDFTIRQRIEAILRKEIPEILQVLDVTDHAAGVKPYYQPAK